MRLKINSQVYQWIRENSILGEIRCSLCVYIQTTRVTHTPQFQSQSCQRAEQCSDAEDPSWSQSPSWDFAAHFRNDPPSAWTSEPPPNVKRWNGKMLWLNRPVKQRTDHSPTKATHLAGESFPPLVDSPKRAFSNQLQDVKRVHVGGGRWTLKKLNYFTFSIAE